MTETQRYVLLIVVGFLIYPFTKYILKPLFLWLVEMAMALLAAHGNPEYYLRRSFDGHKFSTGVHSEATFLDLWSRVHSLGSHLGANFWDGDTKKLSALDDIRARLNSLEKEIHGKKELLQELTTAVSERLEVLGDKVEKLNAGIKWPLSG